MKAIIEGKVHLYREDGTIETVEIQSSNIAPKQESKSCNAHSLPEYIKYNCNSEVIPAPAGEPLDDFAYLHEALSELARLTDPTFTGQYVEALNTIRAQVAALEKQIHLDQNSACEMQEKIDTLTARAGEPMEHNTSGTECWCCPTVETLDDGHLLVIHNEVN